MRIPSTELARAARNGSEPLQIVCKDCSAVVSPHFGHRCKLGRWEAAQANRNAPHGLGMRLHHLRSVVRERRRELRGEASSSSRCDAITSGKGLAAKPCQTSDRIPIVTPHLSAAEVSVGFNE